jgi:cytidylate kinase
MVNIARLVGRQIEIGEMRRRLASQDAGPPGMQRMAGDNGPCLLLSRECGSGGTSLARLIGDRLNWQVYDREIVEEVAHSAHVRCQLIDSVDERVRHGWREFARKLAEGEGVGHEKYVWHLREVILALGHLGCVIILGRGANYILPPECAVRVRLVAPLELRVRRVSERESMSLSRALHFVKQTDAERAEFIRKVFGKDVGAPEDHDLVLDTGGMSLETAAERVLAILHSKLHVEAESLSCAK